MIGQTSRRANKRRNSKQMNEAIARVARVIEDLEAATVLGEPEPCLIASVSLFGLSEVRPLVNFMDWDRIADLLDQPDAALHLVIHGPNDRIQ